MFFELRSNPLCYGSLISPSGSAGMTGGARLGWDDGTIILMRVMNGII